MEQREVKNKKLYANSRTLGTACIRQYDSRFASPRRARPLHNPSAHLNSGRGRGAGRRRAIWSRRVAKTHEKAQNRKNHQVHLRTCRAQVKLSPARFDGNSTSTYPTCSLHWSLLAGRHAWEKRVKKVKRRRRARNGSQNTSFLKYAWPTHQTETRFWPKVSVTMLYGFGRPLGRQECTCLHRGRRSEHGGGCVKKWRVPF